MENITAVQQPIDDHLNKIAYYTWSHDKFEDAVNKLLELGYDGLQTDDGDNTVLHHAVKHGYADVVKSVMQHFEGIDSNAKISSAQLQVEETIGKDTGFSDSRLVKMINKKDMFGKTALCYSAERKDFNLASILIQNGATIDSVTTDIKEFMLHNELNNLVYNAWSHDRFKETVEKLLKLGYDGSQADAGGNTALHYAAKYGYADVVKSLVSQYVDIDINDTIFSTPLLIDQNIGDSIFEESKFTDSRLIKMVNKEDMNGKSALYYVTEKKDNDLACFLICHGACIKHVSTENQKELLLYASNITHAAYGNEHELRPVVGVLAVKVPDAVLDYTAHYEYPRLLRYYLRKGHLKVIDALINAIKDVEIKKKILNTGDNSIFPLDLANAEADIQFNEEVHLELVKYLIGHGATKCSDRGHIYYTLRVAAYRGHLETFKYFLSQGDPKNFNTFIGMATIRDQMNVVKYIWQNYRRFTVDRVGNTALHYATWRGGLESIKYLVDNGANVNAVNNDSETPLSNAIERHRKDIIDYLVSKGATHFPP